MDVKNSVQIANKDLLGVPKTNDNGTSIFGDVIDSIQLQPNQPPEEHIGDSDQKIMSLENMFSVPNSTIVSNDFVSPVGVNYRSDLPMVANEKERHTALTTHEESEFLPVVSVVHSELTTNKSTPMVTSDVDNPLVKSPLGSGAVLSTNIGASESVPGELLVPSKDLSNHKDLSDSIILIENDEFQGLGSQNKSQQADGIVRNSIDLKIVPPTPPTPAMLSTLSTLSTPSTPSTPSMPPTPPTPAMLSTPSMPSTLSIPSIPSTSSKLSTPSAPSGVSLSSEKAVLDPDSLTPAHQHNTVYDLDSVKMGNESHAVVNHSATSQTKIPSEEKLNDLRSVTLMGQKDLRPLNDPVRILDDVRPQKIEIPVTDRLVNQLDLVQPAATTIQPTYIAPKIQVTDLNTHSILQQSSPLGIHTRDLGGVTYTADANDVGNLDSVDPLLNFPAKSLAIRQAGWSQGLASNISWMVKQDISQASINITPAELGPVNIQISTQADQLTVSLVAQQAVTREILDGSIAKLREQFESFGFAKVDVGVSNSEMQQSNKDDNQSSSSDHEGNNGNFVSTDKDSLENTQIQVRVASKNRLLDTFA